MVIATIDDGDLAWMYLDPDYQASARGQRLLAWVAELLGPAAWVVIQTSSDQERVLYEQAGFRVVTHVDVSANQNAPVRMHLARTL